MTECMGEIFFHVGVQAVKN